MAMPAPPTESHGFRHEALLYRGADEFLAPTLEFLEAGIANDERILVVIAANKIRALQSALGTAADAVEFADMKELGANPARIIPAWSDFVADGVRAGRGLRGVGEPIWPGRTPAELAECQLHEALLNYAFDDSVPWQLLCPYDASALSAEVIAEARCTHPWVCEAGDHHASHAATPAAIDRLFAAPLPPPAEEPDVTAFDSRSVGRLRTLLEVRAREAGLGDRSTDLVLAVYEVATNSVRHGGGAGCLRTWTDGDALVCEIHDDGRIDDPLAGRVRPDSRADSGRGLWLANQLCDLVQVRTSPSGSAVRMHMRITRRQPPRPSPTGRTAPTGRVL